MKRLFLASFIIFVGVDAWYEIKHCHDLPWPPRFIFAGIVFGLLDLFSGVNEELAAVTSVGLTLATLVKLHPWTQSDEQSIVKNCQHSCGGSPQPASMDAFTSGVQQPGEILA